MSKTMYHRLLIAAAALLSASASFGQSEIQLRARQRPGWDPQQREGNCQIRVWVDDRAEVRLRGDRIWVTTLQGAKGRDEGSECSQSLPFNSVCDFKIRQIAGRSQVQLAQDPSRANNYTAMIAIEDRQGGGDNYAFEVSWRAESDLGNAPAPFFDDVRACQDMVRQRFARQNGSRAYIDFDTFADRQNMNQNQGENRNQGFGQGRNQGRGPERIQGRGSAKSYGETRDLTYSCVVDQQRNLVQYGNYQYSGDGMRMNQRTPLK
jgi:hypothetical protein